MAASPFDSFFSISAFLVVVETENVEGSKPGVVSDSTYTRQHKVGVTKLTGYHVRPNATNGNVKQDLWRVKDNIRFGSKDFIF